MRVFITGISSGIGKALSLEFANQNWEVYGISRRDLDFSHPNIHHQNLDITNIEGQRINFIKNIEGFDLVILNAGVLGKISKIHDADTEELKKTMDINLWSQKNLIDNILVHHQVSHLWAISSGAANKGSKGWAGYSLSKAAFKILIELYANETSNIQFLNIAPGLVNTQMQDVLCDEVDHKKFSNMTRLKDARSDGTMLTPNIFANKFYSLLEKLRKIESGSFTDLRDY